MPTSTTAKSGRATMRVTTPSRAELEAMVAKATGPALEVMRPVVEAFDDDVLIPEWPRATGESADSWAMVTEVDTGQYRVRVALRNSSGYAQYVRSARFGKTLKRGQFRHVLSSLRGRFKQLKKDMREPVRKALINSLNGDLDG